MLDKTKKGGVLHNVIFILIVAAVVMACYLLYINFFKSNVKKCAVMVIEDESFFSDFEVIDNEVHIYCVVSLKNDSSDIKKVKLAGNFQKEVEKGLLKETSLEACFIESAADCVVVEGNSTVKYLKVEFVGEYAGNSSMSNRMLPPIEVIEAEDSISDPFNHNE